MRPPILWLALAFGAGVWACLSAAEAWGVGPWGIGLSVLAGAALLHRPAPVGAAFGVALVAGALWGAAAGRERAATCAGVWAAGMPGGERGEEAGSEMRAAVVHLTDPAPPAGGVVDARVVGGPCGGDLRLRWPEGYAARGGTRWVVSGRWLGDRDRGVFVVRRARVLDRQPRGRGALREA
ncbi:MAG: hypothetical protein ACREL9_03515, partial [Gemmatimonadales bacterium]